MNNINTLIAQLCPDGVEFRELGDIYDFKYGMGNTIPTIGGKYPVYGSNGVVGTHNEYNSEDSPVIGHIGAYAGIVNWGSGKHFVTYNGVVCKIKKDIVIPKYGYYLLLIQDFNSLAHSGSQPFVSYNMLEKVKIPLPPLPIQQEIVNILDKFTQFLAELQAELQARRAQYEYYRNQMLNFEGKEVEWKTLNKISSNFDSKRKPVTRSDRESGEYPYYGASGIVDYVSEYIFDGDYLLISEDGANLIARNTPIAFSISGKTWVNNHAHVLKFDNYATRRLVEVYLNSIDLSKYISGAAQPKLNQENLNKILIPIPPLAEQNRIVAILDKFDKLVNDISEGLPAEIQARRKQYEYYRGKLLDFKPLTTK